MLTLKVEKRDVHIRPEAIRKTGKIPAVFYGKKEASTAISVPKIDFLKVWKEAGASSIVTLETPEGIKESLIQDVDLDPITSTPRHADFYVFEKDLGGMFVKVLHELKIEAMPKDLPHNIKVDVSVLINFGDQILAEDIILPK